MDEVDSEAFKKAIIKRKVKREADIDGHLLSETKGKDKDEESSFWWKKNKAKTTENLFDDFQILQAYNYLKAYKVMERN